MFLLDLIDDQTLIIIQTFFEIIIACIFIVTLPVYNKQYLNIFKYGFLLRGIGFLLVGLRDFTPVLLTVILANVALQAGFFINMYAFTLMLKKHIEKHYFILLNIINFVLFMHYTFVDPSVGARIVIYSSIQIIPIIYLVARHGKALIKSKDPMKMVISSLYIGIVFTNSLRIYQVINSDKITSLFRNEWVLKVTLLYTLFFSFLRVYMIFIYVAKEYQEALREVNIQLEHLSFIDHLTGINNNRSIMNIVYNEVERGMRYQHKTTIALIDIDNFKQVNDAYGHIFGDVVLKKASEIFAECIRTTDSVGRYGGEEFLIVMPETTSKDGKIIIERIKEEINKIEWDGAPTLSISFSAGVYTIDEVDESVGVKTLIGEVDKILYAAKRKGKDRVELSV